MYTPAEFAKKVGVTVHTLQRWDREERLIAKRTHTNRRYYTDDDLQKVLGQRSEKLRKTVVYCRVSSQSQRPDLENQRQRLEQFCVEQEIVVDEWIQEIGGGLNFKRKKFLSMIDAILSRDISVLVVAHKDRLARFGFSLIEYLCDRSECELVIMNSESLSPEQEMVQDLMTIIHCFSSRLYGLRTYRQALKKVLEDDPLPSDSSEPNA